MGWNDRLKFHRIQLKDMRFDSTIYIESKTGDVITDAVKVLKNKGYKIFGYSSNNINNTYTLFVRDINGGFSKLLK